MVDITFPSVDSQSSQRLFDDAHVKPAPSSIKSSLTSVDKSPNLFLPFGLRHNPSSAQPDNLRSWNAGTHFAQKQKDEIWINDVKALYFKR